MKDLNNKVALVTGAASGIGRALAIGLAREGMDVVVVDVKEDWLNETRETIAGMNCKVMASVTDVSDADAVKDMCERAIEEMGRVDLLANVAGIGIMADIKDMSIEDWDRILGVNLRGPINTITFLINHMVDRGSGHVVNVASGAGLMSVPTLGGYNTSKFGLVGLTETLRAEVAGSGVGVTAVCPGAVKTNIFKDTVYKNYDAQTTLYLILTVFGWTPERMARSIILGVKKNKPMLDLTLMTWAGYRTKRISPWLMYQLQRGMAAYLNKYHRASASK